MGYLLKNPSRLLTERYDSILANAFYKQAKATFENDLVEIVDIDDYLLRYQLSISREDLEIPLTGRIANTVSLIETQVLCMLAKGIKAQRIFEIGTFQGETTVNLAHNLGEEAYVYTINLPQESCKHEVGKCIKEDKTVSHKITLLFGNSKEFDFSPFYNQINLMFIDGDHEYEGVLSDSENALRCVTSNGFIVWHDFDINHLASSTAVLEVCERYGLPLYRIDSTVMAIARVNRKPS